MGKPTAARVYKRYTQLNQESENASKGIAYCRLQKTLQQKFGEKIMWEKIMNTDTKNVKNARIDGAKPASKRVVQKTTEATGDMIGNEIADKITSAGKPKSKTRKQNNEIMKCKKSTCTGKTSTSC